MEEDEDGKNRKFLGVRETKSQELPEKAEPRIGELSDFEEQWEDFSSWRHESQENLLLLDEDNSFLLTALMECKEEEEEGLVEDVGSDCESGGKSNCAYFNLRTESPQELEYEEGEAVSWKQSCSNNRYTEGLYQEGEEVKPRSLDIDLEMSRRLEEGLILSPGAAKNYRMIAKKMRPLPLPEKPCVPMQEVLSARLSSGSNSTRKSVDERDTSFGRISTPGGPSQSCSVDQEQSSRGSIASEYGVRTSGFQMIRESSYSILDRRRRQQMNRSASADPPHLVNEFSAIGGN